MSETNEILKSPEETTENKTDSIDDKFNKLADSITTLTDNVTRLSEELRDLKQPNTPEIYNPIHHGNPPKRVETPIPVEEMRRKPADFLNDLYKMTNDKYAKNPYYQPTLAEEWNRICQNFGIPAEKIAEDIEKDQTGFTERFPKTMFLTD